MKRILNRYREILLDGAQPDLDAALQHAARLNKDGSWPDIDYADDSRSGWQPGKSHVGRIKRMSLALAEGRADASASTRLSEAVERAIDHWLEKRYQATNWWWNRIGVPRAMRDIAVLLNDRMSGPRRQGVIEVIGQHAVGGTGANLVWSAELAMHHACLRKSPADVTESVRRIWDEVKVGDAEGIQPDWSFYQHGPRLQAFHYGRAYLDVVCKAAWQLQSTPWAMPAEKRDIISNYIIEGLQWMCRGTHTVPGTMDRQASRKGSLRAASLRNLLPMWIQVHPERRADLETFLARQNGEANPPAGCRHFPYGDFTVWHHPQASLFLKTISSRTGASETGNSENLKGKPYLHSGDHYVVRTGREYGDMQPVWDWSQLPGLTIATKAQTQQQRQDFVGGLGSGRNGLTAMDYVRTDEDENVHLAARKMWAFHDDLAVCLIGGWRVNGKTGPVATSVEQCRQTGPVAIAGDKVQSVDQPDGTRRAADWVLHNRIGYLPLGGSDLQVQVDHASGTWHAINHQYDKKEVTEPVLRIWLEHGTIPEPAGFAVLLDGDRQRLADLAERPVWDVLRNDGDCQHIRFHNGPQMAAFYVPGAASVGEGAGSLEVDKPCLAIWSDDALWLCDPTHAGGKITVTWKNQARRVDLPAHGQSVRVAPGDDKNQLTTDPRP